MSINSNIICNISDLYAVLESPILITGDKALQAEETLHNMQALSFDGDYLKILDKQKMVDFIVQLLEKKKQQLIQNDINVPVIFYMWFDEMAAQLRFNIISDVDDGTLPFSCDLDVVVFPGAIIDDFFASPCLDGIPFSEFERVDDDNDDDCVFTLKVFVAKIFLGI